MTPNDFEIEFVRCFGKINKATLSELATKVRVMLGDEGETQERITRAIDRACQVLRFCFKDIDLWLRIILWSEEEENNLHKAGFDLSKTERIRKRTDDYSVLYFYSKTYSELSLLPVVKSIVNFDMAEEPSANITCYFINFSSQLIVNIYDDRGLDIYSTDPLLLNAIKSEFSGWIG